MSIYNNLEKNNTILQNIDPIFIVNFINGPYLEIRNSIGNNFDVSFIDKKTGIVHYSTNVGNNCWTKSNISYFVDWKITAKRDDGEVFEFEFDAKDKRVFIALESKSLGDTLAWFPYVDEFRKKWNCSVICSTFHNNLFIDQYPELEFVSPGSVVNGIYAMYKIGLFFDGDDINYKIHKKDPKKISLLEIATDILGIEYSEVRPRLKKSNVEKKKRVGIGFHSTAQTKYWNNPTGWQEVTDFLISKGYEVVIASKEEDGYMGNFYPKGATRIPEGNIENLIDELNLCEFFIGISSGLSWLAWAINIPVVIISGFTDENLEPSDNVVRIIEKSVCNGCWSRHKFNPGDWNWCPDHKETDRQFECTKSITGKMVIDEIINNGLVKSQSLCEIMKRNGSDKGLGKHNYTILYYEFFKSMIDEEINLFEMGIGTNNTEIASNMGVYGKPGASLRGWKEFFKNAKIYGADIDSDIIFEEDRIKTFVCDQTDISSIKEMWENDDLKNLRFDIIIDDGLHEFNANLTFFENSIHKLKKDGYYVIEDLSSYCIEEFDKIIPDLEKTYKGFKFTIIHLHNVENYYDNNLLLIKRN